MPQDNAKAQVYLYTYERRDGTLGYIPAIATSRQDATTVAAKKFKEIYEQEQLPYWEFKLMGAYPMTEAEHLQEKPLQKKTSSIVITLNLLAIFLAGVFYSLLLYKLDNNTHTASVPFNMILAGIITGVVGNYLNIHPFRFKPIFFAIAAVIGWALFYIVNTAFF